MHVVFTNKNVTCQYRAVGHPIAVALTEGIVDLAAQKLGNRCRRNEKNQSHRRRRLSVHVSSGIKFEKLSHHKTLDKLLALMDYKKLREEQSELRARSFCAASASRR